ncbi:YdcF family protein [bacterium]|nr:YdcF family protein [bacterium]
MRRSLLAVFFLGLAIALAWDFSGFWEQYLYYRTAASSGREQVSDPSEPGEVIVVLTGDAGRIPRALELLRARPQSRLLISGAGKGANLTELLNQQGNSMVDLGQVWNRISVESSSASTVENAYFSGKEWNDSPPSRIILVTSDYHMGRSLAIFQKAFPGMPIFPYAVSSPVPASSAGFLWKLGSEYWKSTAYRLGRLFGL